MPDDRDDEELAAVREPFDGDGTGRTTAGGGSPDRRHDDGLAVLRRVGAAARAAADDPVPLSDPPPEVWAGIADTLGLGSADLPPTAADDELPPVVPLSAPRRRPTTWAIAAAAAAVVVIAAIGLGVALRSSDDGDVVASVVLEPVGDDPAASGTADLVEAGDGTLRIELDVDETAPDDAFLEVWLLDDGVSRLIALGPLAADTDFEIPAGVEIDSFPVVDISVEPVDGDPAHSGNSLLRGRFEV